MNYVTYDVAGTQTNRPCSGATQGKSLRFSRAILKFTRAMEIAGLVLGVSGPLEQVIRLCRKMRANCAAYPDLCITLTSIDEKCQGLKSILSRLEARARQPWPNPLIRECFVFVLKHKINDIDQAKHKLKKLERKIPASGTKDLEWATFTTAKWRAFRQWMGAGQTCGALREVEGLVSSGVDSILPLANTVHSVLRHDHGHVEEQGNPPPPDVEADGGTAETLRIPKLESPPLSPERAREASNGTTHENITVMSLAVPQPQNSIAGFFISTAQRRSRSDTAQSEPPPEPPSDVTDDSSSVECSPTLGRPNSYHAPDTSPTAYCVLDEGEIDTRPSAPPISILISEAPQDSTQGGQFPHASAARPDQAHKSDSKATGASVGSSSKRPPSSKSAEQSITTQRIPHFEHSTHQSEKPVFTGRFGHLLAAST